MAIKLKAPRLTVDDDGEKDNVTDEFVGKNLLSQDLEQGTSSSKKRVHWLKNGKYFVLKF